MSGCVSAKHTTDTYSTMITIIAEADSMFRDFHISNIAGSVYNEISRERVLRPWGLVFADMT